MSGRQKIIWKNSAVRYRSMSSFKAAFLNRL